MQHPDLFFIGLKGCLGYAEQKGYSECAAVLKPYMSINEKKRAREGEQNEGEERPTKALLLSNINKRNKNNKGEEKDEESKEEEMHCRLC